MEKWWWRVHVPWCHDWVLKFLCVSSCYWWSAAMIGQLSALPFGNCLAKPWKRRQVMSTHLACWWFFCWPRTLNCEAVFVDPLTLNPTNAGTMIYLKSQKSSPGRLPEIATPSHHPLAKAMMGAQLLDVSMQISNPWGYPSNHQLWWDLPWYIHHLCDSMCGYPHWSSINDAGVHPPWETMGAPLNENGHESSGQDLVDWPCVHSAFERAPWFLIVQKNPGEKHWETIHSSLTHVLYHVPFTIIQHFPFGYSIHFES